MNEELNQPERISSKFLDTADQYNMSDDQLMEYLQYQNLEENELSSIVQEHNMRKQDKLNQQKGMAEEKIKQVQTPVEQIDQPEQQERLKVGIPEEFYSGLIQAFGELEFGLMELFDSLTGYDSSGDVTITELLDSRLKGVSYLNPEDKNKVLKNEVERLRSNMETIDGTFLENITPFDGKGNFIDGIHFTFGSIANSIPSIAIASSPFGFVALGAAKSRSAYFDVKDNKYMSDSEKFWYSTIEGSTDAITDKIGGRIVGKAFTASNKTANKLISRSFAKAVLKRMGISATEEALAEGLAGAAQSINAQYFLDENRDVDFTKVGRDALTGAIIGAIGGGVLGGAAFTAGSLINTSSTEKTGADIDAEVSELNKRITTLQEELDKTDNDADRRAIESTMGEYMAAKKNAMSRKSERYRVMRRRNPKALAELTRLSNQIQAKKIQYESLTSDTAKRVAKDSLESLVKKFQETDQKALKGDEKLTLQETLQDHLDDVSIAINESQADLDAVEGLDMDDDADLLAIQSVKDRVSSLKLLKKDLLKLSGEVEAAMRSGDQDAIAKAVANLQDRLGDSLPSEVYTFETMEQAEDDLSQDSTTDTPSSQEAEADSFDAFVADSDSLLSEDLATESEGSGINFGIRRVINNMLSSFKSANIKVAWHKTDASFDAARGEGASKSAAFYDKSDNTVHLRPNSTPNQVRHEFIHAALRQLMGDAKFRSSIIKEINDLRAKDPIFEKLYNDIVSVYTEAGKSQADIEEEVIVNFIEKMSEPDVYELMDTKSFIQKVINVINNILGTKFNVPDSMLIKDASELKDIVKAFRFAEDTGNRVDVEGVLQSTQTGVVDALSKAYPDLVNKEVTYSIAYPSYNGRSSIQERTVKINDYFHWRNFWASMTGNGRKDWIVSAYYVDDNGKKKAIAKPSPKRDRRTGDVLEMDAKLKSAFQVKWERGRREDEVRKLARKRDSEFFNLSYELKREGIDVESLDEDDIAFVEDNRLLEDNVKVDSLDAVPLLNVKGGLKFKLDATHKLKSGDLKNLIGNFFGNAPYDSTRPSDDVRSGIGNIRHPKDGSKRLVFSVTDKSAQVNLYRAMAEAYKAGEEYFVLTHSSMSDDAVLSNPDIFRAYWEQVFANIEGIVSSEGTNISLNVMTSLMNMTNDFVISKGLKGDSLSDFISDMQDVNSFDAVDLTISDPSDLTALITALSQDNILTFEERRSFLKSITKKDALFDRYKNDFVVKYDDPTSFLNDVLPPKTFVNKYKEEAFSNMPPEAIVSAKRIKLRRDGKMNFRLETIEGAAFPYSITVPKGDLEMFAFEDVYSFYDVYGDYVMKTGSFAGQSIRDIHKKAPRSSSISKVNTSLTLMRVADTDVKAEDGKTDSLVDVGSLDPTQFNPREQSYFESIMTNVKVKLQDRFARVMMLQEDIERFRGQGVSESRDFKQAEELIHGKTKNDLDNLEGKVKGIAEDMKSADVTSDEVSQYLYAKHAKERNAVIYERTEGKVEDGSGMSNAKAEEILNSYEGKKKADIEAIANKVYDIVADTRKTYRDLELESDETVGAFEEMFENYVPLSGVAIDELDGDNTYYPTGGSGMAVYGSTTKRARGRKTEATNILAQVVAQNAQAKVKGRKNEALKTLYNLVQDNPNEKVWRITDTVKYESENAVGVRINGDQKYIVFRDKSMAKSLRNMGVEKLDFISRILRKPAVWLRRSFTTANPEFIISNFARDIQSTLFNAMAEADIEGGTIKGKAMAMKIVGRVKQTLPALAKNAVGKEMTPEMQRYYMEFQEDGGQTGWAHVKPVAEIAAEIEAMTNETSKAKKAADWMAKNSIEVVENMNDAFENSIRLAAYIEARENGVSRGKAAQLAKNITVNFNKHGELGPVLNAWFLFFNASVQGTARLGRSLLRLKPKYEPFVGERKGLQRLNSAQKLAMGLSAISSLLTLINISTSDEDEDGELFYNKIPDYEKERNLIMMYDGKHYIKIPLPYGFNIFSNIGVAMTEVSTGNREAVDGMMFTGMSFMSAFSPISFGQSKDIFDYMGKAVTPTVFKPVMEIMTNETYFGGSVYREQFPVGAPKPESEMSFKSPKAVQDFFRWMNEATGGNEYESGWMDSNPDKFWHIFDYYLGGAGQFINRTGEFLHGMGASIAEGEKLPVEANDVPFMRKLYGDPSKYYDYQLYSDRKEEIQQLYRTIRSGDYEKGNDKYKGVAKLDKVIKQTEKRLKALRQERKKINDLPYAQRQVAMADLFERERKLVMKFNKLYNDTRGK